MKVTNGVQWILICTLNFGETVLFFRDVLGLEEAEAGIPVTDTQFTRFVQFRMPNGVVIEVVEPTEAASKLYSGPVVSIPVDDLGLACRELAEREVEFVTAVFRTGTGWGWRYFRGPDGFVYQVQGPDGD